jgi:hypothetical protein
LDPRDKVYGQLGAAYPIDVQLDYAKSVEDVLFDAIVALRCQDKTSQDYEFVAWFTSLGTIMGLSSDRLVKQTLKFQNLGRGRKTLEILVAPDGLESIDCTILYFDPVD